MENLTINIMSNSERFINMVKSMGLSDEAMIRFISDVETYDRPILDNLSEPTIINITSYGSMYFKSARSYVNDPWSAKHAFDGNPETEKYISFDHGEFYILDKNLAHIFLYTWATAEGFSNLPQLNSVSGNIISWQDLVGSIPEFMRDIMEERIWDKSFSSHKKPHMDKLEWFYNNEVIYLLNYMHMREKRVEIKDDAGNSEWITQPISKIEIGFNRFSSCKEDKHCQTTAFFHASDISPYFHPIEKINWHFQDTSRWLYAGAIAIDYFMNDAGKARISISSNH